MVSAPTVRHYSDPAVALPTPPISASVAQALAAAGHLPVTTVTPQPAAIVPIPPLTTDRPTDDRPTGIRLCLTTPSALPLTPSPTPALATPPSTLQWTLALPSTTWDVVKSTNRHRSKVREGPLALPSDLPITERVHHPVVSRLPLFRFGTSGYGATPYSMEG